VKQFVALRVPSIVQQSRCGRWRGSSSSGHRRLVWIGSSTFGGAGWPPT